MDVVVNCTSLLLDSIYPHVWGVLTLAVFLGYLTPTGHEMRLSHLGQDELIIL